MEARGGPWVRGPCSHGFRSRWEKDPAHFDRNFGFRTFLRHYGTDWKVADRKDEELREFGPTLWEWRRLLRIRGGEDTHEILCCPEDIQCTAKHKHKPEEICSACEVPICRDCWQFLRTGRDVPMALANDNMWGYISPLIVEYEVRWIEIAAVLPYWTCMIVYYVEGDRGHLMNEVTKQQRHRTAVRGHAFSFLMPWEEIVKSIHQKVKSIPRDPECLKYMLRLHLKIAGQDFHQHLKQVHLRPAILVLLLKELFLRKHEAFQETLAAQAMDRHLSAQAHDGALDIYVKPQNAVHCSVLGRNTYTCMFFLSLSAGESMPLLIT